MTSQVEKEIDDLVISQADDEKAWTNIQVVKNHAKRGSREKFLKALSKVPIVEPDKAVNLTQLENVVRMVFIVKSFSSAPNIFL